MRCWTAMHPYDDPEALLKLGYVAELAGVTPAYFASEIRRGRLAAYRIGREWLVSHAQLESGCAWSSRDRGWLSRGAR